MPPRSHKTVATAASTLSSLAAATVCSALLLLLPAVVFQLFTVVPSCHFVCKVYGLWGPTDQKHRLWDVGKMDALDFGFEICLQGAVEFWFTSMM